MCVWVRVWMCLCNIRFASSMTLWLEAHAKPRGLVFICRKCFNYKLFSLMVTRLLIYVFLVLILVRWFEIYPFHLVFTFIGIKLFIILFYYLFHLCSFWSYIPLLLSIEFKNLYFYLDCSCKWSVCEFLQTTNFYCLLYH